MENYIGMKRTTHTPLLKFDIKYPKHIIIPNGYWSHSLINGVNNDKRIYISAGNRKKHVS